MLIENSPNVTHVNNKAINRFVSKHNSLLKNIQQGEGIVSNVYADKGIYVIDVDIESSESIKKAFSDYQEAGHLYPVTKSGIKYDEEAAEIGSYRFCTNSSRLANFLDAVIVASDAFPSVLKKNDNQFSEYAGVSPYFRFMRYQTGGLHFPHYDSDYEFSKPYDNLYTAYSLVMYFSDCETGNIAFINDETQHASGRTDWDRQANDEEIFLKVAPKAGRIVIFKHDLCHSVLELTDPDNERMMVRGDLIFEKVTS